MRTHADASLLDPALLRGAAAGAVRKLDPRVLAANPVIFVTEIAALLATIVAIVEAAGGGAGAGVMAQIAAWLWFTVLFANFAEALAEGRGKARADALRSTQTAAFASRVDPSDRDSAQRVDISDLKPGDLVRVKVNQLIPLDGEVVEGIASVDESAVTGESAPVIRESGGDRSAVTGGTRVVSDEIVVKITARPGESFMDRMIGLVEGAKRQKTPNEVALSILLSGLTMIFLIVVVSLWAFGVYSATVLPVAYLIALFVTLIPTTIGGLLSAVGIAGMDRLVKANVIAKSGRAVEAAGDVDTLLIDKTGTITFGNRMADEFIPAEGRTAWDVAEAASLASHGDETPEGRSIVDLAEKRYKLQCSKADVRHTVAFSAKTRMSGVDLGDGRKIRKGAPSAMYAYAGLETPPDGVARAVDSIARTGGTPLVVAIDQQIIGVIHLKDIVKPGIKARFAELRQAGVRTVMITGDNAVTAAAIAAEAGVDDFLAEADPEKKLELIREEQAKGRLVAMCGDGANDAPALAQADVGVAMNDGTQAAREAGNLIDLDSDPTKLLEIVKVGKQLLISRGALTTFSIANDVAKYFAIIPALVVAAYPQMAGLNVMGLESPQSAILSAVIFNALVIIALIPLALRGVEFRPAKAADLLGRNLTVYGLGGLVVPFLGIKAIDMAINAVGFV